MAAFGRRAGWVLGAVLSFACGSRTSLDLGEYAPNCSTNCAASSGTGGSSGTLGVAGNAGGVGGVLSTAGVSGGGFAGTLLGTAGSAGATCVHARATGIDPTIDNMLDGDSFISNSEGRQGSWYAYNDGTGVQSPPAGTLPMTYFSKWSAYTQGGGFYSWGAGIGLTLENGCPYDASVYQGLSFTIVNTNMDTIILSLQVGTAATTPTSAHGTCDAARELCYDAFQLAISVPNGRSGMIVGFNTLKQAGWGKPVPFDSSQLISISFQAPAGVNFAFYVENVAFVQFG